MDYSKWSELIYDYYFRDKKNNTPVIFHITMQDLIAFAKQENVEIAPNCYAANLRYNLIKNDFVRKFYSDTNSINKNLDEFKKVIKKLITNCCKNNNYMGLLPIVAILVMPICENDDISLHGNEYYTHLFKFLSKNLFVLNVNERDCQFLRNIRLDKIWENIDTWAKSLNLPFKSGLSKSENGAVGYVRSIMKQSLLPPSKIQHFCILFDKAGLVPKISLDDKRLLSAFTCYYTYIGISEKKYKLLLNSDNIQYLISVLRNEYTNWDGIVKIKEHNHETGLVKVVSGNTCYPLFLFMKQIPHTCEFKFGFQLYSSDKEFIEDLSFITDDKTKIFPNTYIKNDGYASCPFFVDDEELEKIVRNKDSFYSIHDQSDSSLTARFVVSDYYLLKAYRGNYVATNEFIKGEFYYVLIRYDSIDLFSDWLKYNNANLIQNKVLGNKYLIYKIQCASTQLKERYNLKFKTDIRCNSVNNIEVKSVNKDGIILLSKYFSAYFEITGVDVSNDKIFAISVNDEHRNCSELTYDHNMNLWKLEVFKNCFQLKKEFQLYCNESPIPYCRTYKFCDFIMPESFKELSINKWGTKEGGDFLKGLELPNDVISKNLINWQTLESDMSRAEVLLTSHKKYEERDFLLYAITSASYDTNNWIITKEWLSSIKERILNEFYYDKIQNNNRYALLNSLTDYARMGYVNYIHSDKGLKITANRPTLILLTPKYQRIVTKFGNKKICKRKCIDNRYRCLLTGGRTIDFIKRLQAAQSYLNFSLEFEEKSDLLMPQTIFVLADSRKIFKNIADKFNILYQDNIYANALLETLPDVFEYRENVKMFGIEIDYDGVKNFRSIDYKKMADLYQSRLKEGKAVSNKEINKSHYSRENDVVTFFPGTKDEETIMITDGNMIIIDKYWGHFIGMLNENAEILQYDEENARIYLPSQLRLPSLYARALTLITGCTPNSIFGSRSYYIGVNPYTNGNDNASDPHTILRKLGQNKK